MKRYNRHVAIIMTAVMAILTLQTFIIKASHFHGNPEIREQIGNYPTVNSLEDRIVGLSRIWSEVKYNFVNIDQLDFNIDSLYEATLPKVISAKNDIEFYGILDRFCASFNDGHTQLLNATYRWNDYFDYIPCNITEINNKFYFTSIRQNAGIDSTMLYSEIVEVEGVPTLKYIKEQIFPSISASTYSHKLMQATAKLCGGLKFSRLNGKAKMRNGEIVDFSIVRNGETTRTENDKSWGRSHRNNKMAGLEWENDIAILQINTFGPEQIINALDSLAVDINKKAKGLVIDLRLNGGGNSLIAEHLQMYLTQSDSLKTFGAQTRINNGYGRSQGNYREEYADFYLNRAYEEMPASIISKKAGIESFKIPIAILIGPYSFSACEDFLVNIYEIPGRPILIGQATGGSTGAPLMISLPHDVWARVCSLRITYPYSGKPFLNEGIQPDIVVVQSLDDYMTDTDPCLIKAMEYLNKLCN